MKDKIFLPMMFQKPYTNFSQKVNRFIKLWLYIGNVNISLLFYMFRCGSKTQQYKAARNWMTH